MFVQTFEGVVLRLGLVSEWQGMGQVWVDVSEKVFGVRCSAYACSNHYAVTVLSRFIGLHID